MAIGCHISLMIKSRKFPSIFIHLFLITICNFLFLAIVYSRPFFEQQDIGSSTTLTGLNNPEENEEFSFAYTSGSSTLYLPQAGTGTFIANLRLGSNSEKIPLYASVGTSLHQVTLKPDSVRVYHVLLPPTGDSAFRLYINSTTFHLESDPRDLGIYIDWLSITSRHTNFPLSSFILTSILLILFWHSVQSLNHYKPKLLLATLYFSLYILSWVIFRNSSISLNIILSIAIISLATSFIFIHIGNRSFRRPVIGIFVLLVFWKLIIWGIAALGIIFSEDIYYLGRHITIFGSIGDQLISWSRILSTSWFHWDTGFYQDIAENGYKTTGQWPTIAFFPLYPIVVRCIMYLFGIRFQSAALIVSHLALFITSILLYQIVSQIRNHKIAYRTIMFLLAFPTSFFFVTAYTESLALMLLVCSVWAIQRQQWWAAGAAGFFLALTRLPGILIAPIMAFAYLQAYQFQWRALTRSSIFSIVLPPAGLALFMLYQWWQFDTPVAFMIAQRAWENRLQPPWAMPYELLMTLTSTDWPMKVLQSSIWLGFILLTILAFRKLPIIYGLVMLLFLTPPYLSSWNESLPRYILMAFPGFIVLGIITERSWLKVVFLNIMLAILYTCTMLFINDFWIS